MDARKKLVAVKRRLGKPRQEAKHKGEYGFLCPGAPGTTGCSSAPQGKVRLWVNPATDRFNCWHCGFKGGSLAALMVPGSPELREYLDSRPSRAARSVPVELAKPRCTSLPDGFTPFALDGSRREAPYLSYLLKRGLSRRTVALYRMGYVDGGQLAGRVVIPSFDHVGMVNFWSARSIHPNETTFRYRLPIATKDVVSNEHMVDWTKPVYLVEGIFDEIAIGPQAIAVYGKFALPTLLLRLVEKRPPRVNICLDDDAIDEAWELAMELMGYDLQCAVVTLGSKDPAVAGLELVQRAEMNATIVTDPVSMLRARLLHMSGSTKQP